MEIIVEKYIDRKKLADTMHTMLDVGCELIEKGKLLPDDHAKIKVMRVLNGTLSSATLMLQQETVQQRLYLIQERMKQLGYDSGESKAIGM